TQTVEWADKDRWRLHPFTSGLGQDTLRSLFDNRQFHACVEQGICSLLRVGSPDCHFALLTIANRDCHLRQSSLHLFGGVRRGIPEHRTVVKIKYGELLARSGVQDREMRLPAGLLAKTGDRQPHQPSPAYSIEV